MTVKRTKTGECAGFTLIELLIVIVVIMVLVGILLPTIYGTKKQAKVRQARAEMTALEAAIISYKMSHREWPYSGSHSQDALCDKANAQVITELLDENPPLIDESDFRMDGNKNVLDPWGAVYVIKLDTNYDGYWDSTTNQFLRGVSIESVNL